MRPLPVQGNGRYWFNLPHSWQAGWSSVQVVDGSVLGPGVTLQLTLNLLSQSYSLGVHISVDWASGQGPIFLSYRLEDATLDPGLVQTYSGRTNIHTSNATNTSSPQLSFFITGLLTGGSWTSGAGGVVVTQLGSNATQVGARG